MSCNFHVGQKVVCVDAEFQRGDFYDATTLPVEGTVYTVRDVFEPVPGAICIRLDEIVNDVEDFECGMMEAGFMVRRFRPVVERKTDISIFKAMLNPSKQRISA